MSTLEPFDEPLRPRRGPQLRTPSARRPRKLSKRAIEGMLRNYPEVMAKITSNGKSMARIRSQVDYISRHGRVPVEDQDGNLYIGPETVSDSLYTWTLSRHPIPETEAEGYRRESLHLVFSMPPRTDRAGVSQAVRKTAEGLFGGHEYLFATHDDEPQPHVHMVVRMTARDGSRLNPRKADLQHWREMFADNLMSLGIEANATPRFWRGRVERAKSQAVIQIDKRLAEQGSASRVTQAQEAAVRDELNGKPHVWEDRDIIEQQRTDTLAAYAEQITEFLKGDKYDKQLAGELAQFARNLPPVETAHERRVRERRQEQAQERSNDAPDLDR